MASLREIASYWRHIGTGAYRIYRNASFAYSLRRCVSTNYDEENTPDESTKGVRRRKNSRPEDSRYITDQDLADEVAEYLRKDIANNRYIMEANPGPGLLSKRLIELNCKHLFLYEDDQSPHFSNLDEWKNLHPSKVQLRPYNILRLPTINARDKITSSRNLDEVLAGLPRQDFEAPPQITLFANISRITEINFLHALLYALSKQTLLFSLGRVDLLLFVSQRDFSRLFPPKNQRRRLSALSALFGLFFNLQYYESFEQSCLQSEPTDGNVHLVRLSPSTMPFDILGSIEKVWEFVFFVRQAWMRNADVLFFNDFIPHVARKILIETYWRHPENCEVRPFTKLHSIDTQQLLHMFRVFSQNSLYPKCSIHIEAKKADTYSAAYDCNVVPFS